MQVVDWEEGGRTTAAHVQRIFDKEQAAGPSSVQAIIHRYSLPSQLVSFYRSELIITHIAEDCAQIQADKITKITVDHPWF